MSKSLGNYVGVTESPTEMFGKLMSISDELMWTYYELLTDRSVAEIRTLREQVGRGEIHPKRAKLDLARAIVCDFHSPEQAAAAETWFERDRRALDVRLSEGVDVRDLVGVETVRIARPDGALNVSRLVADLGFAASASEATRQIKQGGVRIDGERVTAVHWLVPAGVERFVLAVGARKQAVVEFAGVTDGRG